METGALGREMMAKASMETKALSLLQAFERSGKSVTSVIVEGRKIELVFSQPSPEDEFEGINMRHGKT